MANNPFDILVVGSGHAGIEAAGIAAQLGHKVLVVTVQWDRTGQMSCNPSIGGLAKGHIVKEIDILGGLMGRAADYSCLQFKRLNSKKGPAVRGSRMQCDKDIYSACMRKNLLKKPSLSFVSAEVKSLILKKNKCRGVITDKGESFLARVVILTTGTFMKGLMHIGSVQTPGGRVGEKATEGLSDQLKSEGFKVFRLKTGTPARAKKKSIDFQLLTKQEGDKNFIPFSFFSPSDPVQKQEPCYITYTNEQTHEIIRKNLKLSPLYTGAIQSQGPRYCPSIEDKVLRFKDKNRHQSFLEPETLNGQSIYLQGLSTSLPESVQMEFLKTLPGLKQVELLRPGYAVEYDFFDPLSLFPSLQTKAIENLFFAGQINGSSGYEEAAGQGLLAGINASHYIRGLKPLVLKRHEAYIGVLIDDLVTKGTKEPYRMLTSRAEHRLVLREDNAIDRLFDLSETYRLLPVKELDRLRSEREARKNLHQDLKQNLLQPVKGIKSCFQKQAWQMPKKPLSFKKFLSRPEVKALELKNFWEQRKKTTYSLKTWEALEIQVKYEGYIKREKQFIARSLQMEGHSLKGMDYDQVQGLSLEALEKLKKVQPQNLAQASRISGVGPAALQALIIHIKLCT